LVIGLCAKTAQTRRRARCRGLIGGVCRGEGSTGTRCRSDGSEMRVALGADRGNEAEASYLLTANRREVSKDLPESVGTNYHVHT